MAETSPDASSVLVLRAGHGANCSSIGSVVDALFVTSLLGGALFAACVGALGKERIEVVGEAERSGSGSGSDSAAEEEER